MKITFLVYNIYGMGGTVRTVINTANYFASKNHDVEIISVRRTSAKPMFDIDKKVKITPIFDARRGKLFGKNTPLYQKIIKKILMKFPSFFIDKSEDLYHMFNLFVDFKIIAALKKINKGILITTIPSFNILATKFVKKDVIKIGQEHLYFAGHAPGLQNKIKKYYKKLDALTCLTDSEINDYEQLLIGSKVDLYKVENATDIPEETADLDKKVVIAAGRYAPEKGFDLLIPAFSKVIKKHPDWKLKIFGSGVEEEALREKIFEEKAYNNIFLMQKTNNIIGEMCNASIYALSSRYESFGMVIIEAMSVGVPCVGFACTGPREVITHKEDGILVEEGNVEELANSLMMLIESEELRKEYGRNAKKNVERYTFNVVGDKWENVLEDQAQKTIKQDKKALAEVSI
ncbi:glycosyltransferase family 4 protein [Bacillus cereus]|uniref:glycosyltransferase family 4 protein n=1 Tax=Bacillus cereus TaxID=1396 RepID=UPI0018F303F7|nr:glycosyltransferase family 4 protein [Bacillus cereus]MBJ8051835.1 glycosyltransferase family 4 protein [Bacillus cereus]